MTLSLGGHQYPHSLVLRVHVLLFGLHDYKEEATQRNPTDVHPPYLPHAAALSPPT
jgi:hypothetical protein